jgi:hypothetical protein
LLNEREVLLARIHKLEGEKAMWVKAYDNLHCSHRRITAELLAVLEEIRKKPPIILADS